MPSTPISEWEYKLHLFHFNTLRPRQNGRHFPGDILKWIFLNKIVWISINIEVCSWGLFNDIPSLVQIMTWRRPGDKTLSEPRMGSVLTHICVSRPQWVKHMHPCAWSVSKDTVHVLYVIINGSPCIRHFNFNITRCTTTLLTWNV